MRERINREYSRVVFLQKTLAISHKNTYIILRDDEKEKERGKRESALAHECVTERLK